MGDCTESSATPTYRTPLKWRFELVRKQCQRLFHGIFEKANRDVDRVSAAINPNVSIAVKTA